MNPAPRSPATLVRFAAYFLRLGATGFGGPVALANYMRRDLVEARLTATIALLSLAVLVWWKKCPEPLLVGAGAVIGLVAYPMLRPEWLLR